jgi:hypothetical protein
MLLTKNTLKKFLENQRVSISKELEQELLDCYGGYAVDEDGHLRGYTEQDIYEQLRKRIC